MSENVNTVIVNPNGPFTCRGRVTVVDADGNVVREGDAVALCRCGASKTKPFCDGSHGPAGFADEGTLADPKLKAGEGAPALKVTLAPNGPLILDGQLELRLGAGEEACQGVRTALCRCGQSANKPFCDGAHKAAGFTA
jgi:CDGSH-type Zn-finger protein